MQTRDWALASLGLFTAGFVAMWILDASLPAAANLTDPQLWAGALALGGLGLAAAAWSRSATPRSILAGAGIGALGFGLLLAGFYGFLAVGAEPGPTVAVHRTNETPASTLDVDETHREVPELARALDELVESNASEVHVTDDEETFQAIVDHLVEETGDYVDPFSWRGTAVELSVART